MIGLGKAIKRIMDVAMAATALVALGPLLLLLSLCVAATMGLPVMYRSPRSGLWGKTITVFKFRTMTEAKDSNGKLLPDDRRITPLGRFLRRTSLDELPQLFNVLKGNMSIVGPRPLPVTYWSRLTDEQKMRSHTRPGVTGWTQINYVPGDRTWEEKLAQDVWYVRNWSLALDCRIIALTVPALFVRYYSRPEGFTTSKELAPRDRFKDRDSR